MLQNAAPTLVHKPPGSRAGDRDRSTEPHDEGRDDARPEHALRKRINQNKDRARTGPQADRKNRRQAAFPSAGTREFCRLRSVRMAAMLVVNMRIAAVRMTVMMAVIMMMIVRVIVMRVCTGMRM